MQPVATDGRGEAEQPRSSTSGMTFDFEHYLTLLEPFRVPAPPLPGPDARLAEWRWPPLRPYNGFSGELRVRVWQLQRFALDAGTLARPQVCSVCRSRAHVGFHNETYADPWNIIPLCHACHMAVHGRFRHPDAWARFQTQHHRSGEEQWFEMLPGTLIALDGRLRANSPSG